MLLELMHPVSKPGAVSHSSSALAPCPVLFPFVQFAVVCLRTLDKL